MGRSVPAYEQSTRVDSLDSIRPQPAKAALSVNASQSPLRALIAEAIRRGGSQKAAAIEMHIDPAQLTRQLQNGHLTIERLESLDAKVLAELGKELVEQYAPLSTPAARVRELARRQSEIARELEQLSEFIA